MINVKKVNKKGRNPKYIKEPELFNQVSINLLHSNKEQMNDLKEKLSLMTNEKMENSCLIRSMISYFSDHQEELVKLKDYAVPLRGHYILRQFIELVKEGKSANEIQEKIGIDREKIDSLKKMIDIQ